MQSLGELQNFLQNLITDSRGLSAALAEVNLDTYKRSGLQQSDSSTKRRLEVYAEGYFFRILESLEKDFHLTAQVLGRPVFSKLVADYLKKYPSRFFSLADVGRNLPLFVTHYEPLRHDCPWLSDLCFFEWQLIESHYAVGAEPADALWFQRLSTQEISKNSLVINSSVRLTNLPWDFDEIERSAEIKFENTFTLIYRFEGKVYHESLNECFFTILNALKNGETLGEVLDCLEGEGLDAASVRQNFSHWVSKNIITGVALEKRDDDK